MSFVNESNAIKLFANVMTPFIQVPPGAGSTIVDVFEVFCRDLRIENANDAFMFEWGSQRPHLLHGFTDIRGGKEVKWDEKSYQWVGLTRQVQSRHEDDDTALCVNLFFAEATGDEPAGNYEASDYGEFDAKLAKFRQQAFVAKLLATSPSRVVAFASEVG